MRFSWLVLILGCASLASSQTPSATFFSLGDRRGEIQPCGCPRIQLGGLTRLVAYLDDPAQEKKRRFLFDSGNSFFSLPALPESRQASELRKAKLIADAYRLLEVDVLVPGPRDSALGKEVLLELKAKAGVRLVASNLPSSGPKPSWERFAILERDGVKVGVAGLVAPDASVAGQTAGPVSDLKSALDAIRIHRPDITVALVQDREQVSAVRELGFDVVVPPPAEEGKGIGRWTWRSGHAATFEDIALDPKWERENRFRPIFQKYLSSVRQAAIAAPAKPERSSGRKFVAQAGQCRQCHQKQHDFWEKTSHASAYLVLFARNQHFDPECIGCHSVGYRSPEGFRDIASPIRLIGQPPRKKGEIPFVEKLMEEIFSADPKKGTPLDSRVDPERYALLKKRYHERIRQFQDQGKLESLHMGVQCEHCHGNRHGHPSPGFKKVGAVQAASCLKCHVVPHDPGFDFKKQVAKVGCPRN